MGAMVYGVVRVATSDSTIDATLTSKGWESEDEMLVLMLNGMHPPEVTSDISSPWNAILDAAAAECRGKVSCRKTPHSPRDKELM
jgi:hypothetical protein